VDVSSVQGLPDCVDDGDNGMTGEFWPPFKIIWLEIWLESVLKENSKI